ncbi:MAG: glycogen/starch synthase [Clostridia bacterium]|nr:glycogen/starch synthase [Clostridia bacterium]
MAKAKVNKVLFVTTEASPFAATGGMGEVCTNLARALNVTKKTEARIMLPLYEDVAFHFKDKMTFVCNITVGLAWRNQYCGLFRMEHNGVVYYFIDNEYYFKRTNIYGYYDDAERFAFLSRAALDLLPYLDFKPDILQSNDHLTALVPIYYNLHYKDRPGYERIKNIFTIHNINYQGIYPLIIAGDVFGLSESELNVVEFNGRINLAKGAIVTCDKITTMSPQYAREIRLPEFSGGLDSVLTDNREKIVGILNGIDTEQFDPATSESLFVNYDANSFDKKKQNKLELQRMLSLPEDVDAPMVCMIAHMVPYKGYDLLRKSINKTGGNILDTDIQLVLLGQGDPDIEGYLSHIQNMYNGRVRSLITYNRDLALKVLAAADICLIPSRMEPCGLTQMGACRFGAVPIVRATGGLMDSITDCGKDGSVGNGFVFEEYDSDVMDATIRRALALFAKKKTWNELAVRAMACDFSWGKAALEYNVLYRVLSA